MEALYNICFFEGRVQLFLGNCHTQQPYLGLQLYMLYSRLSMGGQIPYLIQKKKQKKTDPLAHCSLRCHQKYFCADFSKLRKPQRLTFSHSNQVQPTDFQFDRTGFHSFPQESNHEQSTKSNREESRKSNPEESTK